MSYAKIPKVCAVPQEGAVPRHSAVVCGGVEGGLQTKTAAFMTAVHRPGRPLKSEESGAARVPSPTFRHEHRSKTNKKQPGSRPTALPQAYAAQLLERRACDGELLLPTSYTHNSFTCSYGSQSKDGTSSSKIKGPWSNPQSSSKQYEREAGRMKQRMLTMHRCITQDNRIRRSASPEI